MHKTAVRLSVVVVSALVSVSLAVVFTVRVWFDALGCLIHLIGDGLGHLCKDWVGLWNGNLRTVLQMLREVSHGVVRDHSVVVTSIKALGPPILVRADAVIIPLYIVFHEHREEAALVFEGVNFEIVAHLATSSFGSLR